LVEGSNLGGLKFAFFFAKKLVWPEYERVETTLGDLLKNEKEESYVNTLEDFLEIGCSY